MTQECLKLFVLSKTLADPHCATHRWPWAAKAELHMMKLSNINGAPLCPRTAKGILPLALNKMKKRSVQSVILKASNFETVICKNASNYQLCSSVYLFLFVCAFLFPNIYIYIHNFVGNRLLIHSFWLPLLWQSEFPHHFPSLRNLVVTYQGLRISES